MIAIQPHPPCEHPEGSAGLPYPLDSTSVRFLSRMLWRYGFSPRCAPRVARFLCRSAVTAPMRFIDRCVSRRRVARANFDHPPVFVIGHWRTGTTHLHNLLLCDPRFGRLTTFHTIAVDAFLAMPRLQRRLVGLASLPKTRTVDGIPLSLDTPQEEELAMARSSPLSCYHGFSFPSHMCDIFRRTVLFEDADAPQLAEQWRRDYRRLLLRLTIDQGGRPLCLKNPANTARIRQLLELFPDARFVHIYRNPYVVYQSTLHLWKNLLSNWAFEPYDMREVEENVVDFYRRLMQRYFEDAPLIPPGRLVEVRFEDLEVDPAGETARVYDELSLPGFAEVRPRLEAYLASLGHYRKNSYPFDPWIVQRVEDAWGFAIARWGYAPSPDHARMPSHQPSAFHPSRW